VVVVNKPAGVSTVAFDQNDLDPLDERVRHALAKRSRGKQVGGRAPLGVVHRLDKETSGLLVFTRTWLAKENLSRQMRDHTVHRRYLAIVNQHIDSGTFVSHLVANRGDNLRGSLEAQRARGFDRRGEEGRRAVTHVDVLARGPEATLVACRLETGRTHQIRIHLSEAGHPLVGERVYIRDFRGSLLMAPRLMLHAAELGFTHPATGAMVKWEQPPPADFLAVLKQLQMTLPIVTTGGRPTG
jgi:23S rRNA pseudouridine1911/1915/1917 synthase